MWMVTLHISQLSSSQTFDGCVIIDIVPKFMAIKPIVKHIGSLPNACQIYTPREAGACERSSLCPIMFTQGKLQSNLLIFV